MFNYNATKINGSRWVSIPNTESTNLTPGIGYEVNVRGNRNSATVTCDNQLNNLYPTAPEAVVLSATGTVTTGNVSVALNDTALSKYTLIGNPYPSAISFAAFQASNTGVINNKMWTYSPYSQTAGNYTTCLNGVFTNQATGYDGTSGDYLASGQAFFTESNNNGSVSFAESHKITNNPPNNQYFGINMPKLIRVGLTSSSNTRLDEVVVRYAQDGTKSYNSSVDAVSLNGGNQVLVTLKDDNRLAITTHPDNQATDTISLGVTSATVGTFRLNFSAFDGIDSSRTLTVIDRFLGKSQDIRANQLYEFNVTSDSLSKGDDRFKIVVGAVIPLPINTIIATTQIENNQAVVKWNTIGGTKVSNYAIEKSIDGKTFNKIGEVTGTNETSYSYTDNNIVNSYYRIKAIYSDGTLNYSNTVKLTTNNSPLTTINVYPNPLVGRKLNLSFDNVEAGKYIVSITNTLGQKVAEKELNHSIGISVHPLTLDKNLATGVYNVSIHTQSNQMIYHTDLIVR